MAKGIKGSPAQHRQTASTQHRASSLSTQAPQGSASTTEERGGEFQGEKKRGGDVRRRTGEGNWEKEEREERRSEIYLRMDKDLENGDRG